MYIHPVSPRRIFFFVIFALVIVGHRAAAFQSRSVTVQATTGNRIETTPGKLLTLGFKVTNTTSSKKRFESVVVPPSGWRRLAKDFPFEIEGGAADIRLLSISIPAETPAEELQEPPQATHCQWSINNASSREACVFHKNYNKNRIPDAPCRQAYRAMF